MIYNNYLTKDTVYLFTMRHFSTTLQENTLNKCRFCALMNVQSPYVLIQTYISMFKEAKKANIALNNCKTII